MKIIIFILISLTNLFCIDALDETNKNTFWGDTGYILETDRVKEDYESQIKDKKDNDSVSEYERWFFRQTLFFRFNYRYSNIIELGTEIGLSLRTVDDLKNFNPYTFIKELYIKASPIYWASFNFGKQRLKWGTSSVFHPIDKLETVVDPFGARIAVDGVTGIKATFIPADWLGIQALILPDMEVRYSKFALRFDFLVAGIDIGVGGIKYDAAMIDEVNDAGQLKTKRYDRGAFFFDIVKYFGNFGIMGEFEFRFSREKEYGFIDETGTYNLSFGNDYLLYPVFRASIGINYQMDVKPFMKISSEYFFSNEGFNWYEARDFYKKYEYHKENSSLPMILPQGFGNFGSFNQHYLSLFFSNIEFIDFFSFQLGVMWGIETLAFDFSHGFTFNIKHSVYITFKHDFYYQFLNKDDYPSDLNFWSLNHKITMYVSSSLTK